MDIFIILDQKWSYRTPLHQTKKKINIVFGPDQSKWTSGFSWCEYTLRSVYSWHGDESSRTVSDFFTRLINYDS